MDSALVGMGRIRRFKRTNSSPILSAKSLHKLRFSGLPFIACKYSESNRKQLLKFAARRRNGEIDEGIKSQAVRHVSCDQDLYQTLRREEIYRCITERRLVYFYTLRKCILLVLLRLKGRGKCSWLVFFSFFRFLVLAYVYSPPWLRLEYRLMHEQH